MTTQQPSLPVIVIGGVYEFVDDLFCRTSVVTVLDVHTLSFEFGDRLRVRLMTEDGGIAESWADSLRGPIAMPCPICGEMVQVVDREGDNDLQNHLFWKCKTTPQDGEGM